MIHFILFIVGMAGFIFLLTHLPQRSEDPERRFKRMHRSRLIGYRNNTDQPMARRWGRHGDDGNCRCKDCTEQMLSGEYRRGLFGGWRQTK